MCAPVEAENVPAPHGVQTAAPAGRERARGPKGVRPALVRQREGRGKETEMERERDRETERNRNRDRESV
jgi:hypothetical protein